MIDWLRKGPPSAHVERVEVSEATPTGPLSFDIREDA
jgi:acylphosphatase